MSEREPGEPGPHPDEAPRVRDRDVLAVLASVVAAVLVANVLSASVPEADAVLAAAPVVVIVLLCVTALVLLRAMGRGARRR